jgi:ribosome-binding factor A
MSLRSERVQKAILQLLQPAVREMKDPELVGFVTLTECRISPDFKTAMVYFSVLGSEEEQKATGRALDRAQGFLRHLLAENLQMRTVPKLKFIFDPTPERADRIDRILHDLEKEHEGTETEASDRPEEEGGRGSSKG